MADSKPPEEEWRTIPHHPDYEVSSLGRVRSYKRPNSRRLNQSQLLKPHADPAGYIRTMMDREHIYVHQAVAAAWYGLCPDGMEVDHINSIRGDNRPENLRYLTRQDNLIGRVGTMVSHCKHGHAMIGDNLYIRPSNGRRECRACSVRRANNRPVSSLQCSAEGCIRTADCRLRTDQPICEMHYQRARKVAKRRLAICGAGN